MLGLGSVLGLGLGSVRCGKFGIMVRIRVS